MGYIKIVKAKDEKNSNEKDLVLCTEPSVLDAYMQTHNGTIVAVKYADELNMAQYHIEDYTLENIGYKVITPNGYERAYNLQQNGVMYGWGVIDSTPKN